MRNKNSLFFKIISSIVVLPVLLGGIVPATLFLSVPSIASAEDCLVDESYFSLLGKTATDGSFYFKNYSSDMNKRPIVDITIETHGCVGKKLEVSVTEEAGTNSDIHDLNNLKFTVPASGVIKAKLRISEENCGAAFNWGTLSGVGCQYHIEVSGSALAANHDSSTVPTAGVKKINTLMYDCDTANGSKCNDDGPWQLLEYNTTDGYCLVNETGFSPKKITYKDDAQPRVDLTLKTFHCSGKEVKLTLTGHDADFSDAFDDLSWSKTALLLTPGVGFYAGVYDCLIGENTGICADDNGNRLENVNELKIKIPSTETITLPFKTGEERCNTDSVYDCLYQVYTQTNFKKSVSPVESWLVYDCDSNCTDPGETKWVPLFSFDDKGNLVLLEGGEKAGTLATGPCATEDGKYDDSCYEIISGLPLKDAEGNPLTVIRNEDFGKNGISASFNSLFVAFVALASVIAVVMIVVAAVKYMSTDSVTTKELMRGRLLSISLGILLLLGMVIILRTINPDLLRLEPDLQNIEVSPEEVLENQEIATEVVIIDDLASSPDEEDPGNDFTQTSGGGAECGDTEDPTIPEDAPDTPPESPADTTPPTISDIATTGITTSKATITWKTDEDATTLVEYGTNDCYGETTTLNSGVGKNHSADISNLVAGAEYHFRVISRDLTGNTKESDDNVFTAQGTPPPAPPVTPSHTPPTVTITSPVIVQVFTAPAIVTIKATATSTDGTISKVEFFQNDQLLAEDTTSPYLFSWTSVSEGTYSLMARATTSTGMQSFSPVTYLYVAPAPGPAPIPVPQAPLGPTLLTAKTISETAIELKWKDNSTVEDGYVVERSTSANGAFATISTLAPNTTTFTDSGLTANTKYFYRVYATGNSLHSTTISASTETFDSLPANPSDLILTAGSGTTVTVNWTDNSTNELGFWVKRSTATDSKTFGVSANEKSFSDTGLTPNTHYSYQVQAHNSRGTSAPLSGEIDTPPKQYISSPTNVVYTWGDSLAKGMGGALPDQTKNLGVVGASYKGTGIYALKNLPTGGAKTLVVISLGSNDAAVGETASFFRSRYEQTVNTLLGQGAKVVVLGLNRAYPKVNFVPFDDIIRDIAKAKNIKYVENKSPDGGDNLHYKTSGYKKLLATAMGTVSPVTTSGATCSIELGSDGLVLPKKNDLYKKIDRLNKQNALLKKYADKYGVDCTFLKAIMAQESGGAIPINVSKAGARGIMQMMPTTAWDQLGGKPGPLNDFMVQLGYRKPATKNPTTGKIIYGDSIKPLDKSFHDQFYPKLKTPGVTTNQGTVHSDYEKATEEAIELSAKYVAFYKGHGCALTRKGPLSAKNEICDMSNLQDLAAAYNGGFGANYRNIKNPSCGTNWRCATSGYYADENRPYVGYVTNYYKEMKANPAWSCGI